MARPRSELSAILHALCENVYFQPPTGTHIEYPCIVYDLERFDVRHADNAIYTLHKQYLIKYITRDPDDDVPEKIIELPLCSSEHFYISDNLYHYPFRLYF